MRVQNRPLSGDNPRHDTVDTECSARTRKFESGHLVKPTCIQPCVNHAFSTLQDAAVGTVVCALEKN